MTRIETFKDLLEDFEEAIVDLVRIEEVGPSCRWEQAKDKRIETRENLLKYAMKELWRC